MNAQSNPRYHMWNRLLGPYSTKEDRQTYASSWGYASIHEVEPSEQDCKDAMNYLKTVTTADDFFSFPPTNYLDTFSVPQVEKYCPMKEDNMYNDTYNKEEAQIEHLENRLHDITTNKYNELRTAFFIDWEDVPKTVGEIRDRLTNGKFMFKDNGYRDDYKIHYMNIGDWLTWRTVEADREGFEAVAAKLTAAKKDVEDTFLIDYKTGLEALKAFEGTTFH